jgi:hypothetical protein
MGKTQWKSGTIHARWSPVDLKSQNHQLCKLHHHKKHAATYVDMASAVYEFAEEQFK